MNEHGRSDFKPHFSCFRSDSDWSEMNLVFRWNPEHVVFFHRSPQETHSDITLYYKKSSKQQTWKMESNRKEMLDWWRGDMPPPPPPLPPESCHLMLNEIWHKMHHKTIWKSSNKRSTWLNSTRLKLSVCLSGSRPPLWTRPITRWTRVCFTRCTGRLCLCPPSATCCTHLQRGHLHRTHCRWDSTQQTQTHSTFMLFFKCRFKGQTEWRRHKMVKSQGKSQFLFKPKI